MGVKEAKRNMEPSVEKENIKKMKKSDVTEKTPKRETKKKKMRLPIITLRNRKSSFSIAFGGEMWYP